MRATRCLDLLVPAGIDDDRHPSGGKRYARELAGALVADGWSVRTIEDPAAPLRTGTATLVDGALLEDPERVGPLLPSHAVPLLHAPPSDRPAVLDLLSRAPVVVTTSAATREHLLDLQPGSGGPHVVVAQPGHGRTRAVAVSPSGRRIRCVAAVVPQKSQDVLLAALGRLRDLDWTCELVGPLDLAPRYVAALRELAERLGIADRVLFAGAWNPDPVPRLYEGCDVLVLPSRSEGYGTVVAEAVGCGVPVIASDTGGTREAMGAVRSARPGLLVRPGDPAELARALRAWLSDRGLRLDLTGAARARNDHRRTWVTTARTVAAALERVPAEAARADRVVAG